MKDVFTMVPAGSGPLWFFAVMAALLLGLLALFGSFVHSAQATRYEMSADGLRILGGIYGRTIPLADLAADEAKAVDLARERDLQLRIRTNGVGLPGYQAGWFRLRNGGKALAFVTDRHRVVQIPTRTGYILLLSVTKPEEFVRALRQAAGV